MVNMYKLFLGGGNLKNKCTFYTVLHNYIELKLKMHISHDIAICHIFNTEYRGFLTSIFQDDIKRDNFLFIQPISQTTLNVGPPYSRTH